MVASLEELLISQYNQDFNEVASEEKTEMSIEDKGDLERASEGVLQDGHYNMKLHFRRANVSMPNNCQIAEQRLQSLKRKMKKDQQFKQEYVAFLNGIFENNYTEEVPQEELIWSPGRIWYILHHEVYHPKKRKLRVVFDHSASYQGVSLNTELLQGPDLINSLVGVILRFHKEPIGIMADIKSMLCSKGGFQLSQWVSNSRAVLASIPQEQRAKEIRTLDLGKDSLPVKRALGLRCVDSSSISISAKSHTPEEAYFLS